MLKRFCTAVLVVLAGLAIIVSCSSGPPAPNKVVIEFLEKDMANSDTASILAKLDMPALVQERKHDFIEAGDSLRAERYKEDSLLADLTAGGELNNRWLALSIIVSRVIQKGDSAQV